MTESLESLTNSRGQSSRPDVPSNEWDDMLDNVNAGFTVAHPASST